MKGKIFRPLVRYWTGELDEDKNSIYRYGYWLASGYSVQGKMTEATTQLIDEESGQIIVVDSEFVTFQNKEQYAR